jgi:hypothetical protein
MQLNDKQLKGLFINPAKANCSIYESGRMVYKSLLHSKNFSLDYVEIDQINRNIPDNYDFYAFNYHHDTMGWLETRSLRKLPGFKVTFVLETLPNDPFVFCPSDDFDAYCALDPTMDIADKRVYAFPRPLEIPSREIVYHETPVPVIGSFGFATPGKGFELVVDAVNREFEEAVVRINIPPGTFTEDIFYKLHNQNYAEYLSKLCSRIAKKGVTVQVTRNYMTKDELIEWCGCNTLNCFFYNRMQPGLSATTDQAISSGRPLVISTNPTFRHIHPYVRPYPFRTLKEAIELSQPEVLRMQRAWTPENFAKKFESVLDDFHVITRKDHKKNREKVIKLKKKSSILNGRVVQYISGPITSIKQKALQYFRKNKKNEFNKNDTRFSFICNKKNILLISHNKIKHETYQYAIDISEALQKSTMYHFYYAECSNAEELIKAINDKNPEGLIYNYNLQTMPWLTRKIIAMSGKPSFGMCYQMDLENSDKTENELFDYYLSPDPISGTNPNVFRTKRLIPPYINMKNISDIVTIGIYIDGFENENIDRIIEMIQREFNQAKIEFILPPDNVIRTKNQLNILKMVKKWKNLIIKPGIKIIIRRDVLNKKQILDSLAGNTLNIILNNSKKSSWILNQLEYSLAVQRPIAIAERDMFPQMKSVNPSIDIEKLSLQQIIDDGIVPLVPFYTEWSEAAFILDYERIISNILCSCSVSSPNE